MNTPDGVPVRASLRARARQAQTYTNLAWPEDPYGTGQLWRAEPHLLAGLATCCAGVRRGDGQQPVPVAHAVVYLPLHRTRPIDADGGVEFGFRAVAAPEPAGLPELLRLADLDVLRARRLAKVVTGYALADDLRALVTAVNAATGAPRDAHTDGYRADPRAADPLGRGLIAMAEEWPRRYATPRGTALRLDIAHDIACEPGITGHKADTGRRAGGATLPQLAADAQLNIDGVRHGLIPQQVIDQAAGLIDRAADPTQTGGSPPAAPPGEPPRHQAAEWLAVCATERALLHALIAARHLHRYTWAMPLDVGAAVASCVSGCFPTQQPGTVGPGPAEPAHQPPDAPRRRRAYDTAQGSPG
ncbi:hypothetical protein [Actinomadura formosensis]|uniref:hypothetical protein n=1 Tax=Actinomadura formosensis TaxID=60706 RepID=UPI003D8DDCAF